MFYASQREKYYSKNAYYACHGQVDKKYISRSSVTPSPFRAELRRIIYSSVVSVVSIAIHNHKNNQRVLRHIFQAEYSCEQFYAIYTYCYAYDFFITFSHPPPNLSHGRVSLRIIILLYLINQIGIHF